MKKQILSFIVLSFLIFSSSVLADIQKIDKNIILKKHEEYKIENTKKDFIINNREESLVQAKKPQQKKEGENDVVEVVKSGRDILIENLANAKTEKERSEILLEYKKQREESKEKKAQIISERSKAIFEKFDIILNKLTLVQENINSNINKLSEIGSKLKPIDIKYQNLLLNLDIAKKEKALAWLKLQNVDFSLDKNQVLEDLSDVKEHLTTSKNKIREASVNSKEIIFFIRGAITNLK